ncbi:MAG: exosortase A [Burkholderiales bacterium]|nr:exosortase A [Burkholderiales bacterium]
MNNSNAYTDKRIPLGLTALALCALLAIFWPTFVSIAAIWERSETFAHGYIIFPISAYLIWQRRAELLAVDYCPDWRAALLLLALGSGWLLARAGGVQVIEQYAVVTAIPLMVWGMLGWRAVSTILFPLAFLLLAVPFGEFLIPPLMNFTADFVVTALQLTGMPVYREGTFFTIPSGQWSVVEGCSGLRYLIASFTLGTLYAYLTYRSAKRRIIFSLLSILVPIIANGLRAYMIVMIAHLSDMQLALGVDHYIYGWVFFGLVMLLLFWIGAFWREDDQTPQIEKSAQAGPEQTVERSTFIKAIALMIAVTLPWALYAHFLDARSTAKVEVVIRAPNPAKGWQAQATPLADWKPHYLNASAEWLGTYTREGKTVGVYLAYYHTQRQDVELINSQNVMIRQKDPVWSNIGESARPATVGGASVPVTQTLLKSDSQRLLIWEWNRINGRHMNNASLGKIRLALTKVLGLRDDGASIVVFTSYEGNPTQTAPVLQGFIADMLPAIEASLDQAANRHGR